MTAIAKHKLQTKVPFSRLAKGPITVNTSDIHPAIEQVTFKKTGIIGGYIGYTIPTEFVECTVKFSSCDWSGVLSRADDKNWAKAVEEAVRLYDLLDDQEPATCDLEALRAEWQAHKDTANPFTDVIVNSATCTSTGLEFVRYYLAYVDQPLELNTDLSEVIGMFAELESTEEGGKMYTFITRLYQDGQEN